MAMSTPAPQILSDSTTALNEECGPEDSISVETLMPAIAQGKTVFLCSQAIRSE